MVVEWEGERWKWRRVVTIVVALLWVEGMLVSRRMRMEWDGVDKEYGEGMELI
jgi:hypothetical protein